MGSREELWTAEKLQFISNYLKPHKNNLDELIIDKIEKKGDKLENYEQKILINLKNIMKHSVNCVENILISVWTLINIVNENGAL